MITYLVEKIGADKLLHIMASWIIVMELNRIMPWWLAIIITILIGSGKELIDKYKGTGTADLKDFWSDCIGIVLGLI